jgi:hypothetical protein
MPTICAIGGVGETEERELREPDLRAADRQSGGGVGDPHAERGRLAGLRGERGA